MKTKIIEATDGFNWGRFMVAQFDSEWAATSTVDSGNPIMQGRWGRDHVFVMDLVTGEGAFFGPWGVASIDLNKHAIWVCPLFEPWLQWLYTQHPVDLDKLPAVVNLDHEVTRQHNALAGYRRPGPPALTAESMEFVRISVTNAVQAFFDEPEIAGTTVEAEIKYLQRLCTDAGLKYDDVVQQEATEHEIKRVDEMLVNETVILGTVSLLIERGITDVAEIAETLAIANPEFSVSYLKKLCGAASIVVKLKERAAVSR